MQPTHRQLVDYVSDIKRRNHASAAAVVVIQQDKLVHEHYEGFHSNDSSKAIGMDSMFNVASARKSYLALAISFALHERKIDSLDDPIEKYLRSYDIEPFRGTTIRHLVTHSHGLMERADGTISREFDVGEGWAYRGINVRIMIELLRYLYGYDFTRLLKERVFVPLGMTHTEWSTEASESLVKVIDDPAEGGDFKLYPHDDGMGSNLHTTARELAVWGNLHLNMGRHDGIQIIPEEVIRISTSVQNPGYNERISPANGLFWYVQDGARANSEIGDRVPRGSYQILGNTGPLLLVVPESHLVIVRMYNKLYNYGGNDYLHHLRAFSNMAYETFAIDASTNFDRSSNQSSR